MTPSQIEIAVPMDGSATYVTNRALATTILISRLGLLEQSTSIEMWLELRSPTSCPTLRIRFVSAPRQEISASHMSSSTGGLLHLAWVGVGESILEASPHDHHCHVSFTKAGDTDGSFFNIPMLGGK